VYWFTRLLARRKLFCWPALMATILGIGILSLPVPSLSQSLLTTSASTVARPTPSLSPTWSQSLQHWTGLTAISRWVGQTAIGMTLGNAMPGHWRVRLMPYSATDLFHARCKRVWVQGKDITLDETLNVASVSIQSLPDSPVWVDLEKNPVRLVHPLKTRLSLSVTQADVNRYFASPQGQKLFQRISVPLPPFQRGVDLSILEPRIGFTPAGFTFTGKLGFHDAPENQALPFDIHGTLVAQKGELKAHQVVVSMLGVTDNVTPTWNSLAPGTSASQTLSTLVERHLLDVLSVHRLTIEHHRVRPTYHTVTWQEGRLSLEALATITPLP